MRRQPSILILSLLLALFPTGQLRAEGSVEYKVKAACLSKFINYVEWPETAFKDQHSPIVIGVLGNDPFEGAIENAIRDREVGGRKVVLKQFKSAAEAREAHVLFIGLNGDKLKNAMKELEGSPILTVGEDANFIDSGGVVRFFIDEERVAFQIDNEAGKKSGLKISAQLLRLAREPGKGR